jgi:RNA polymerase-binding transcription factor DksA
MDGSGFKHREIVMKASEEGRYRELLEFRKRQLSDLVGDRLHRHGLELHDDAGLPRRSEDTDDDATANSMRDADVAVLSRAARELALIDAAYERLAEGRYGVCVDCEEPIQPERLLAYPEAARCAHCQTRFEKAGARAARHQPA